MPSKQEVQERYKMLRSWDAVGIELGIGKAVAWRYANEEGWEPKRPDLRKALGLPKIDLIKHVRLNDGTFGKHP